MKKVKQNNSGIKKSGIIQKDSQKTLTRKKSMNQKISHKQSLVSKPFKRVIVTSALPYVNNIVHLGNLVCIISADVYTRYLRLRDIPVISILGTDEHGTTSEVKAYEEGLTPAKLCDKYYAIQKDIYDWFECAFDCFGRTSSLANKEITLHIFNELLKHEYIKPQELEQFYCNTCKRFLADRFIGGHCPHCNYTEAKGDQCECCGKLLEATELLHPQCKVCSATPVLKKSTHLFIDLPRLEKPLWQWINSVKNKWSTNARTMTDAWLKDGLRPRCITRDLLWGIPVPGYEGKVFYSWFDAPIGYIGITKASRGDWKLWWQSSDTRLVQFMGKDNIPFHTILFPSFLLGTKEPWTLVNDLSVNEFLNYQGGQFSKSRHIGVFGDNAKETGISADVWRYYLMINRPQQTDSDFSWDDLQSKINSELVGNFGNLVNRTLTFVNRYFNGIIDKIKLEPQDQAFIAKVCAREHIVGDLLEQIDLKEALKEIMGISRLANQYFQEQEPWKLMNTHPVRASSVLGVLVNIIKDLSIMIEPYMPSAADKIRHQLGMGHLELSWNHLGLKDLPQGYHIGTPQILFAKLEDAYVKDLKVTYGGEREFGLNLAVAKITKILDHPNADKLYVLEIELGAKGNRQLVAGLKKHYSKKDLLGKHIIIVANLAHTTIRGIESQGMLLAAEKDGDVKVLEAPNSDPGDEVRVSNWKNNTKQITYEEFVSIMLTTKGNKVVHQDHVLHTHKEEIHIDIPDAAKIK
ncbi:MAG: methionine--tRNA ligase [Nanoarchaeota archaeon]